jgi:hypothetical protein
LHLLIILIFVFNLLINYWRLKKSSQLNLIREQKYLLAW